MCLCACFHSQSAEGAAQGCQLCPLAPFCRSRRRRSFPRAPCMCLQRGLGAVTPASVLSLQHWAGLKEGGGWLRSSLGNPPSKGDGAAAGEALISPVSVLRQPSEATAHAGALLPLPGAPDWPYVGGNGYEVLEVGLGWPHKGPRPPQQAPSWERESEEGYCTLGGGSCRQQSSSKQLPHLQGLAGGREAPQAE